MIARRIGCGLKVLAMLAGAWLISDAAGQQAALDVSADKAQIDASHPPSVTAEASGKDKARQASAIQEGLKLPREFKFRMPRGAAPGNSVAGIAAAGALSITILMLCAIRGLERLVRLQSSAIGYIGFALAGLGVYSLVGMRLLEVPADLANLKVTIQGDSSLVETIVAFALRRKEFKGDPYDLNGVDVYDGSVNLFLAERVDFVAGPMPSLLEPRRKSIMVEVRGAAVAFYQEVEVLGVPMVVTLLVPVEGRTNALRFGEPTARVGTWRILPRALVGVLWNDMRSAMAGALSEARFDDAFNVEAIADGFIRLTLRPSGGGSAR